VFPGHSNKNENISFLKTVLLNFETSQHFEIQKMKLKMNPKVDVSALSCFLVILEQK
jgi:hypothetical protein